MDLGRGFMKEAQVKRALRTLDVPSVDNEMLNKDTTFNKKYKERSAAPRHTSGRSTSVPAWTELCKAVLLG